MPSDMQSIANVWQRKPDVADCPNPTYKFVTKDSSNYDPLLQTATHNTSSNTVNWKGWNNWVAGGVAPVVVNLEMQVMFDASTVFDSTPLTITVFACSSKSISAPVALSPAYVEVSLATGFSNSIVWGSFAYTGHEILCPITRNKILITFADTSTIEYIVTLPATTVSKSSNQVVYDPDGRFTPVSSTSLTTAEANWSEQPQNQFFGDHVVTVYGGFVNPDGSSSNYFDMASKWEYTLKIKNTCREASAVTITNDSELMKINSQTFSSPLIIDSSLFTASPYFVIDVDLDKISYLNANVPVCGAFTLEVTAQEVVTLNPMTHVSFT